MSLRKLKFFVATFLAVMTAAFALNTFAAAEPTIREIYAVAQSGQVDKAREMTREVLRTHPSSAKAHFVMAELDAAQSRTSEAREELAKAESLAPGLPFARAEAVTALRSRLAAPVPSAQAPKSVDSAAPARVVREGPGRSFPWSFVLIAGMLIIGVAYALRSRKQSRPNESRPGGETFDNAGSGNPVPQAPLGDAQWGRTPAYGTQAYGTQAGGGQGYSQPQYPQAQPQYPQGQPQPQPQGGLGGRVMGGLATGLAVGAGVLAAQEIGRHMMGDRDSNRDGSHDGQRSGALDDTAGSASHSSLAGDAGLGSIDGSRGNERLPDNFGIADNDSWDDAGGGGFDGGADGGSWDS